MDSLYSSYSEELQGNEEDKGANKDVIDEVHVEAEEVGEEIEEEVKWEEEDVEMAKSRTGTRNSNMIVIKSPHHHIKSVRHESLSPLKAKASMLEPNKTGTSFRLQHIQSTFSLYESSGIPHRSNLVSQDSKFPTIKNKIWNISETSKNQEQLELTEQNMKDLSKAIQAENEAISGELNEVGDDRSAGSKSSPMKRLDSAVNALKEAFTVIPKPRSHLDYVTSNGKEFCSSPSTTDSGKLPGWLECQQNEKKIKDREGTAVKPGFRVKPVLLNDISNPTGFHGKPVQTIVDSLSGNSSCLQTEKDSKSTAGHALKLTTEKIRSLNYK